MGREGVVTSMREVGKINWELADITPLQSAQLQLEEDVFLHLLYFKSEVD